MFNIVDISLQVNSSNEENLLLLINNIEEKLHQNGLNKVNIHFKKPVQQSPLSGDNQNIIKQQSIPNVQNIIAIASGKGEFINGTRLVYPMEQEAMRYLNYIGNRVFALLFTWLLNQRITDTLCGTKALT